MASAQPVKPSFIKGENLEYKAYFHWGFLWIYAGDVRFTAELKASLSTTIYHFVSEGNSLQKFDWLYKVRDRYEVSTDSVYLKPIEFLRDTKEGGIRIKNSYRFDRKNARIYIQSQGQENGIIKQDTLALEGNVRDVLSAIYYCRLLPFSTHQNGDQFPLRMIVNCKIYTLSIKYLGKEAIRLHNQKEYSCFKISIQLPPGTLFKGGKDLSVWLSADANRIPLLVDSKILFGSIRAEFMGED